MPEGDAHEWYGRPDEVLSSDPDGPSAQFRKLSRIAIGVAKYILHSDDDAMEIAQFVMGAYLACGRRLDEPGAWIARVSSNAAIDVYRRRRRRAEDLMPPDDPALQAQPREAPWRRYGQDLARATVAEVLRVTEETVTGTVAEAKRTLRDDPPGAEEGDR